MNDESLDQKAGVEDNPQSTNGADLAKRRRILVGGSVGAILASAKSGSALAGGQCVSPSAFSSITANPQTSQRPAIFRECSSHGYYGNSGNGVDLDSRWSPVSRANATLSNAGFTPSGLWHPDTKLFDILKTGQDSLWQDDGNLLVIYLDVMTGKAGDVMTERDVKDLWAILFGSGSSNPKFSGWSAATVRSFYDVWVNPSSGF